MLTTKFIPYSLITVADKDMMKHTIMQHNNFIEEMAIVTFQGINHEKKYNVKELFSKSLNVTGFEKRKKYKEGRYLLITTKVQIYRAQKEANQLLRKNFSEIKNPMTNKSRPSQFPPKIQHNYFSNYTVNEPVDNKYSYPPLFQRKPVSISFPIIDSYAINYTPTKKRTLFNDSSSPTTVHTTYTKTTAKPTTYQPTVSSYYTCPMSWKKELSEMIGNMKGDVV